MGTKNRIPPSSIDSVVLKSLNRDFTFFEKNFLNKHNLQFHQLKHLDSEGKNRPYINEWRVFDKVNDDNRTLFDIGYNYPMTYQRKLHQIKNWTNHEQSVLTKSHGIKTHDHSIDSIRHLLLIKLVNFHKDFNLDFTINEFAIAFDIEVKNTESLNNFLLMVVDSKDKKIIDPNKFGTDGEYKLWDTVDPNIQVQMYVKHIKEHKKNNDIGKSIIRCEVTFYKLERLMTNDNYQKPEIRKTNYTFINNRIVPVACQSEPLPEGKQCKIKYHKDHTKLIEYIEKVLSNLRLFYFENPKRANPIKSRYNVNLNDKHRSTNFIKKKGPDRRYKSLFDLAYDRCTHEINLSLSTNIKDFIVETLTKTNQPHNPLRHKPQNKWEGKHCDRKKNRKVRKVRLVGV